MSDPPLPVENAEFSADRRRADGSRSFWATTPSDAGCTLIRWDGESESCAEVSSTHAATWTDAVAADADLVAVCDDEITLYTAPDSDALLELLHPEGVGDPHATEWPFEVDEWTNFGRCQTADEGWNERWASVNGLRVNFAQSDAAPIAYPTENGGELAVGQRLGNYSAWGEWAGESSEVWEVRPGVAVAEAIMTDSSKVLKGLRYEPTPAGVAAMLTEWLDFADENGWPYSSGPWPAAISELSPAEDVRTNEDDSGDRATEAAADEEDDVESDEEDDDGDDFEYSVTFTVPDEVQHELRQKLGINDRPGAGHIRKLVGRDDHANRAGKTTSEHDTALQWSDVFTPIRGVPAAFKVEQIGAGEFLVEQLTTGNFPSRVWPMSPIGPDVSTWAFLDGGVHRADGFGGGLDNSVRVFGWQTLRWVTYGLRLTPSAEPLPGEDGVPSLEELQALLSEQRHDDLVLRERADLLSAVTNGATLRNFVQRTFGDRGLSGRRGPDHPAPGVWGTFGFTVAAAELLDGRLDPPEADRLIRERFPRFPRAVGEDIADRFALQREIFGHPAYEAEELLGHHDSAPSAAHDAVPAAEAASSHESPTLADMIVQQYEEDEDEDEDFDPDGIEGETLVSLWWDNDTGMPNWCGGADLVRLADGSAVVVQKGDSEGGIEPVRLSTDGTDRAAAIASWIAEDYHSGFAALDLEPLDPDGTLSEQAQAEWLKALAQTNSYTQVTVGAIEPLLREALGRDSVYARVRAALAAPTSDDGQLLLAAIRATGDGGSFMHLEDGSWEDLEL